MTECMQFIGVATPGPKPGGHGQPRQYFQYNNVFYYNNNDIHSFNGCGKHVDSHWPTRPIFMQLSVGMIVIYENL